MKNVLALLLALIPLANPLLAQLNHAFSAKYEYIRPQDCEAERLAQLAPDLVMQIIEIDSSSVTKHNRYNYAFSQIDLCAYTGLLINNTDSSTQIFTQDGSLAMVMEAKDSSGTWRPIELWRWSDCGNSFGMVVLAPGEQLSFQVPVYQGEIETDMRMLLKSRGKSYLYSPEFKGHVTTQQLYGFINSAHRLRRWDNIRLDEDGRLIQE